MTIGLTLDNHVDAVTISDIRVTMGSVEYDLSVKTTPLQNGVLMYAGNGSQSLALGKYAETLSNVSLDEVFSLLVQKSKELARLDINAYGEKKLEKLIQRAEILEPSRHMPALLKWLEQYRPDPDKITVPAEVPNEQRQSYINHRLGQLESEYQARLESGMQKLQARYDNYVDPRLNDILKSIEDIQNNPNSEIGLILVGHDKGELRKFVHNPWSSGEIHLPGYSIGSAELAQSYYNLHMQGTDRSKLSQAELLFFGLNAYNHSTQQTGVGGLPNVSIVTENGTRFLEDSQVKELVHLSAIHLSWYWKKPLTQRELVEHIDTVISGGNLDYKEIEEKHALEEGTLKGLLNAPYAGLSAYMTDVGRTFGST